MSFKKEMVISILDKVIYFSIVILPFSMAIAIAPMNVFMGFLIVSFLVKKILQKEPLFTNTSINLPLMFLFIITCVSIINSISLQDSLKGGIFKLLRYIFVFFIMVQEVKDKSHIRMIVASMISGVLLVSIDSIWQVLTGKDFVRGYEPILNIGLLRATASFKDSNTFGIYLSALAPVVFGLTLYYFRAKKRFVMSLVCIMTSVGVFLTYSRPTLLAVYIALFFLGLTKKNNVLILILIAMVFIAPFLLPESFKQWAGEKGYNPLRVMCNDDRIAIFRHSINMIKDHPIIGVGANTYMKNYKYYKESPEYRNVVTSDYVYAHNNFLHMAAEIGIIGLCIFIWLLYRLFLSYRRIYRSLDDNYVKIVSLCLIGCLIAFLINGLTESSLFYSRVAVVFWYIIGLSYSLKKFTYRNDLNL